MVNYDDSLVIELVSENILVSVNVSAVASAVASGVASAVASGVASAVASGVASAVASGVASAVASAIGPPLVGMIIATTSTSPNKKITVFILIFSFETVACYVTLLNCLPLVDRQFIKEVISYYQHNKAYQEYKKMV